MRKALSFVFSACFMTGFVSLVWLVGVIGQRPQIPAQIPPGVTYFDIMLPRQKPNLIDVPQSLYPLAEG